MCNPYIIVLYIRYILIHFIFIFFIRIGQWFRCVTSAAAAPANCTWKIAHLDNAHKNTFHFIFYRVWISGHCDDAKTFCRHFSLILFQFTLKHSYTHKDTKSAIFRHNLCTKMFQNEKPKLQQKNEERSLSLVSAILMRLVDPTYSLNAHNALTQAFFHSLKVPFFRSLAALP